MSGDDQLRLLRLHLIEHVDPGSPLLRRRGIGRPNMFFLEHKHATNDGPVIGVPQIMPVRQQGRTSLDVESVTIQLKENINERGDRDQARWQVRPQRGPRLELPFEGVANVLDHDRSGPR